VGIRPSSRSIIARLMVPTMPVATEGERDKEQRCPEVDRPDQAQEQNQECEGDYAHTLIHLRGRLVRDLS
jgi:hypothetical protein